MHSGKVAPSSKQFSQDGFMVKMILKKYFVHASFYIRYMRAQKEILISFYFDQETLPSNIV